MTLFNYILKDFFRYVVGTIVLCLFLFIMFDFIHKSTKFTGASQVSTNHLMQFYLFQIPNLFVQAIPIASLLASVTCMVLLSRTNEITAMRAAGMGPLQIGAPIAAGGLILSLLSLSIGEFVAPISATKMRYVEEVLINGEKPSDENGNNQWLRRGNQLYHFEDYDPIANKIVGVRIIETGLNFRPKHSIEAKDATYQKDTEDWLLTGIKMVYFNPNGTIAYIERRDSQAEFMPVEPLKLQKERRKPNELSIKELFDQIKRGQESGVDISSHKVDLQVKLALHFAAFVVCLIGLKFGYRSERTVETARSILIAISIGISYWFILSAGKALGKRGLVPPFIAAWMANVIIFSIGSFEIWRSRRAT